MWFVLFGLGFIILFVCFGLVIGNDEKCTENGCGTPASKSDGGFAICDASTFTTQYLDHPWIRGACDIDKLPASTWLTSSRVRKVFMKDYLGKKPVLLTNVSLLYNNPKRKKLWTHDVLIDRHGDLEVPVMIKAGRGRGLASPTNISSLLKEKMHGCADAARISRVVEGDIREAPYTFCTQNEILHDKLPWSLPHLLKDFGLSKGDSPVCGGDKRSCYLAVGASGSGINMHVHRDAHAFSEVVFGRKAWYLQKPDCQSTQAKFSSAEWLLKPLPTVSEGQSIQSNCSVFHSVVQNPTDVLYLPPGYHHATFNVDETIGAVIHVPGKIVDNSDN